jgi:hypothetical protein
MVKRNLVYGASETRANISEIQRTVKSGLIPKVINKNTHDTSYMFNQKILESLLNIIKIETIIEFDKDLPRFYVQSTHITL